MVCLVHTMWGVNIYSTLAGMIANSLSFSLFVLFLGAAVRDARDGRFRLRTVLILVLVMASHFFTTIIAAVVVAVLPLMMARGNRWTAFRVLALEGVCAGVLMAWWLVPLVAKLSYSVDFGGDWPMAQVWEMMRVRGTLEYLPILSVFAVPGLILMWRRGDRFGGK